MEKAIEMKELPKLGLLPGRARMAKLYEDVHVKSSHYPQLFWGVYFILKAREQAMQMWGKLEQRAPQIKSYRWQCTTPPGTWGI